MPEFPSLGGGVNDNDLTNGPTFTLGNERMANFHGTVTSRTYLALKFYTVVVCIMCDVLPGANSADIIS